MASYHSRKKEIINDIYDRTKKYHLPCGIGFYLSTNYRWIM